MKRNLMSEKFEIHFPPPPANHEWKSDASARRAKPGASQQVTPDGVTGRVLNQTPPGQNINDQGEYTPSRPQRVMSGQTDVSHDWSPRAVAKGFTRLPMSPTEDMETNEHNIPFYDERTTPDGDVGFIEDNNVMDRA